MTEAIIIDFDDFQDFLDIAEDRDIQIEFAYDTEGILILNESDATEEILWALQVLREEILLQTSATPHNQRYAEQSYRTA
jgi:hypothetical protein